MIYGHVRIARLAANIRAARAHAGLSQKSLASRMRALGYKTWSHQAVGNVENNNRPLFAAEILGLALALGVTMSQLMGAPEGNHVVALPSGLALGPVTVRRLASGIYDRPVVWAGGDIAVTASADLAGARP